jgi:hypothetical protein
MNSTSTTKAARLAEQIREARYEVARAISQGDESAAGLWAAIGTARARRLAGLRSRAAGSWLFDLRWNR